MKTLLILSLFVINACVAPESMTSPRLDGTANASAPQQGEAVDAVFARPASDLYIDADPVQARAASFGKVTAKVDAFPWNDQLVETVPVFVTAPIVPATSERVLSADIVDSDPLATRGWR
jgi:hypothetical protein